MCIRDRGLGASLAIGIMLVYYNVRHKLNMVKNPKVLLALFTFILFCTVSTGGIGIFVIFLVFLCLKWILNSFRRIVFKKSLLIILPLCLLIVFVGRQPLSNLVQTRFLDRNIGSEADDATIQAFLKDNPRWWIFGPGSGNIHQLAEPYVPITHRRLNQGQILNSRYGHIKMISENGIVGLILFFSIYLALIYRLSRITTSEYRREAAFLINVIFVMLLFYLARANYVYPPLLFMTGIGFALVRMNTREALIRNAKVVLG